MITLLNIFIIFLECLHLQQRVRYSCQMNGHIGDCKPNPKSQENNCTGSWYIICKLHWRAFEIKGEHIESFSQSSHMFSLKQLKLIVQGSLICLDHFRLDSNMDASASKIKHIRQRRPF